jgi:DNA modification methylase
LAITYVAISELRPDPRNPRKHNARQLKQLDRSVSAFGFVTPILIDAGNTIIAGHARHAVARRLGLAEVPVVRLEHLSPAQARALAVADNRLTDLSTWDERLLGELFAELATLDLDFDLEAIGFSLGEIDLKIEGLTVASSGGEDPADQIPGLADTLAVSRLGDLWHLDRHRLLCGDALAPASYDTLLCGEVARVVFTDPPYNVKIHGHVCGNGAIRHREFAMASGEMTHEQFADFLDAALRLQSRHSADGALLYLFMDWRHLSPLLTAGERAELALKNICVWVKPNAGLGSLYRAQHEFVVVLKRGNIPHRNNVQLGTFGRNRTNVWSYPSPSGFGRAGEEGNLAAQHPTVKPVRLIADALLDASARGEIVLDPFLGSGSTLIAAHRVGRICRGIEIDPLYVDVAIRRWQRDTGEDAVLATTGERSDDIATRAESHNG